MGVGLILPIAASAGFEYGWDESGETPDELLASDMLIKTQRTACRDFRIVTTKVTTLHYQHVVGCR